MTMHAHHTLGDKAITPGTAVPLTIRPLEDKARFNLRIAPEQRDLATAVLGLNLPGTIGGMASAEERTAVCLGPDEWYVMAPAEDKMAIEAGFAAFYAREPHSLVDISHREVSIVIEGRDAALVLQSAIAFDVDAMAPGSGCRTIFDSKAQIIVLRESTERFQIEVWPSFATHVWQLLEAVTREIELDI